MRSLTLAVGLALATLSTMAAPAAAIYYENGTFPERGFISQGMTFEHDSRDEFSACTASPSTWLLNLTYTPEHDVLELVFDYRYGGEEAIVVDDGAGEFLVYSTSGCPPEGDIRVTGLEVEDLADYRVRMKSCYDC